MCLISVSWMGRSSKAFSRQPDTVFVAPWNHKFTEMNTFQCEIQISVFGILFHVFRPLYGGKGKKPASSPPTSTVLLSTGFRKSSSEDLLQVPLKMKDLLRIMTTDPPLIQALSQPFPRAFLQHLGSIYPQVQYICLTQPGIFAWSLYQLHTCISGKFIHYIFPLLRTRAVTCISHCSL